MYVAFSFLKGAALALQQKKINQWAYWLDPPPAKKAWIEAGFERGEFYFIEISQEIVGMYRLMNEDPEYWGSQPEPARYLHSLVVSDRFSGKNIGRQVVAFLAQQTLQAGITRLRLDCDATNHGLCAYYESLGFEKVGEKQMPLSLNSLYERRLGPPNA